MLKYIKFLPILAILIAIFLVPGNPPDQVFEDINGSRFEVWDPAKNSEADNERYIRSNYPGPGDWKLIFTYNKYQEPYWKAEFKPLN